MGAAFTTIPSPRLPSHVFGEYRNAAINEPRLPGALAPLRHLSTLPFPSPSKKKNLRGFGCLIRKDRALPRHCDVSRAPGQWDIC